ncbi:MAG TPA: hypothetical protein PKD12_02630 [Nitrospira sp.]|nr:hypothetical protein [Nitrospira sp.]
MAISIHAFITAFLLLGCAAFNPARASEQTVGKRTEQLQVSYAWYDEKQQERRVWMNLTVVAEISPTLAGDAVPRSASSNMREVPSRYRGIRLWALNPETQMETVVSGAQSSDSGQRYYQVMHDVPYSGAPIRLAPGNIIVHFSPEWSEAAVQQWAASHKLEILRRLPSGPNNYVIQSGPGLEAISLANSLHRSPGVTAAFPNWAIPRGHR